MAIYILDLMRNLKLIVFSALCLVFLFNGIVTARTLDLVTLQYPPYEYEENGQVKGIAVDVVDEVFRRMDQPIQIRLLPWARAIKLIEAGKADAVFTAYKNPTREIFADYSKEVLMPQIVSLFVRNESSIEFTGDLSSLNGYIFGMVRKISYGQIFDTAVKSGVIRYIDYANTGEVNIQKLLNGRFDILVSNKYGALHILKKTNNLAKVKELQPALESVPSYIAFSKKRNLSKFRDRFDRVLANMKADGTYRKILSSH